MNSLDNEHISFEKVSYTYPEADQRALCDISVTVPRGQYVVLMGSNGAGKTTFCRLLNGVNPHSTGGMLQGTVRVAGLDTKLHRVAELSQKVGLVLEDPEAQLFTGSVKSEVVFGAENLGIERGELADRLQRSLKAVCLEDLMDRVPTALSGGQKQRLAIASVIAMYPEILVLDEPVSQLDPAGCNEVFSVIRELNKKYGLTIIMAAHQSEEIARFCDRILVFAQGRIIGDGSPREIFANKKILTEASIREPQVTALARYLGKKGIQTQGVPVTNEEMEQYLLELWP